VRVKYLFEKDKKKVEAVKGAFESSLIVEALKRVFPLRYRWCAEVHIADEYYFPVSPRDVEDARQLCREFNIPLPTAKDYKAVVFDCDDFSFYMKGLFEVLGYFRGKNYCFGVVWVYSREKGYGHALNFFIDEDLDFMFFEPQTSEIFAGRRDNWYLMEVKV
jgi:hypothetical protein